MGGNGMPRLDMLSAELCEEGEAQAYGYRTEKRVLHWNHVCKGLIPGGN